jgi:hypothetical protein
MLTYSIENIKRDEICQSEDIVAIRDESELKNVFFSDNGVSIVWIRMHNGFLLTSF